MRLLPALVLVLLLGPLGPGMAAPACPPAPRMPSAAQLQQASAVDRGLLWRLTGPDGRSAYLYGTLHLGRPHWQAPGPQLRAALAASDTLALELDTNDPATLQQLRELSRARGPAPSPALRRRLAEQTAAACLPDGALAGLHPLMQALTLTALQARWDGLDPAFALEQVLSAQARALRLRIVALETPATQLDLLLPADAAEAQALTEQALDQLTQDKARPVLSRLVTAWERGNLADLEDYENWCDCIASPADRDHLRRLNDGRNPALADAIVALHAGGARVFAAVGALHMTGPQALPRLLAERGLRVERLPPSAP